MVSRYDDLVLIILERLQIEFGKIEFGYSALGPRRRRGSTERKRRCLLTGLRCRLA